MHNITYKDVIKLIGTVALCVAASVALVLSNVAVATPLADKVISRVVHHEVACYAFAKYSNKGRAIVKIHLGRIKHASGTAGAVYRLGYVEGLINGMASANAQRLGGYIAAQTHAASYFYKVQGCNNGESI